ncbi:MULTISPECIES: immunity protein Imm33 domain-containing protein [Pseudomonas aeruginosa group]|uniref:Imm33-like domain-containing protein n=2 Tax=Pseudomonas paraeruginosa TaxID=2994495 RepID=A0A2R3IU30_9PSED|nr:MULTISPECIES: hypothetical protein [Pseudomonas aeruginosa group]VTS66195.1 Uncharacterised protein [Streptococcus dysgalactiae subsp. equisimilis]ABR84376.1 hypothetical protein PSPA7_5640 [Pseudomonas aeruginosa PA7]AVK05426.1 hypothetical protein CSB93_0474 [Pseudomonas paraeruginosa]AWE89427.1 hypothetical protein CSC28_5787 [Pseudomonas paraeruginosa]KAB0751495.1 hypothetical protein F7O94_03535 [Pseudomonas aeruginosa]
MGVPSDRQLEVCRRHGLEPRAPEPMLALALRTLGDSPLHGSRIELPEGGNVSWFIHAGEYSEAEDFYQPVHAAHLAELLPEVLDYLYLPPGARFLIDGDGYEDVWLEPASA